MKKEMLINVLQPEECRIAIVEDGILEELYVERTSQESYVGNIYKGRIVNIEPSIQAAFVDFGIGRNGFLHVSDVEPAYYRHLEEQRENGGRRRSGNRRDQVRGRGPAPRVEESLEERFPEPEPLQEEPVFEPEEALEAPTPAEPEATPEPTRSEGRPRSRGGRSRRRPRQGKADKARPETDSEKPAPPSEELAADHEPQQPEDHDAEPPRYMNSAEHRTEEGLQSGKPADDDDLFFPRSEPAQAQPVAEESQTFAASYSEVETTKEPSPRATARQAEDTGYRFSESTEVDEQADEKQMPAPMTFEDDDHDFEEIGDDEDHPAARMAADRDEESAEEPEFRRRRQGPRRDDRRDRPRRRISGRPGAGRPKPLIQDIFRRGQEVLVQVIKEGIGTKGPTLSTYISIAGRYLVLMPGLNRVGVSRKIADDEQRHRLRMIFHELQPPKGLGFIIRTAGLDKTKKELQRDLAYLSRLWQVVVRRIRKLKSPAEIYQESDMITRTIRDTFTNDIDTIWVDESTAFEHAQEFLQIVMPRYANRIKLYSGSEPLFHKYGIEEEIARIQQRHVPLPHGGSIVIDQTEALVAIDVNSGNFRADNNAEETAYRMNLQAAKEIARQLRLRDLGGVIVNDFIDMREEKHRRDVERALRDAVRRDRARTKILKISQFGLIEMTRQRIRPSLKRSVYQDCPNCHGTSQVKTTESMSIDVMRMLQLAAHRENIQRIQVKVHEDVANYLLNRKRKDITRLEESGNIQVTVTGAVGVPAETLEFVCYDNNNNEIKFGPYVETRQQRRR
jgi:ribonuclease E